MHCPECKEESLQQHTGSQGTLIDVCSVCHGIWLDCGEIYDFSDKPQDLNEQLGDGLKNRRRSNEVCPRCLGTLEEGVLPGRDIKAKTCPQCGGLWFPGGEVQRVNAAGSGDLQFELPDEPTETDERLKEQAEDRLRSVAAGALALPNLFLRSALTLVFLYGLVTLVLIALVQVEVIKSPLVALIIGVVFAILQFTVGPWLMDLSLRWLYSFRWLDEDEVPDHLHEFISRVCAENKMKFPYVGLINDGAPAAFTYGHHPSNARVVISKGILKLLEPEEVEAVVAHELGHARNWDMALMTVADLVPLLLFYLYRVALEMGDRKDKGYGWAVAIGAYVLFIISEYIVLWFSRTREYFADRFAGQATGNPNALASALVKIAYGLAAQGETEETEKSGKGKKEKKEKQSERMDALGALNIFDRKAAVSMVMASATDADASSNKLNPEWIKSAMQWDLWNPWALYYELHSTHPLVAKRLQALGDQAAQQGQEPLVIFDRKKPESYWDEFAVDLGIMMMPFVCFMLGLVGFLVAAGTGLMPWQPALALLTIGISLAGLGSLIKTNFVYKRDFFPRLSVAALLHKVKVSAVRPVPATLTGTIIGKGVPGLIWSEDWIVKDKTGILFLDYQQPLAIWDWLFGLLRAGQYQGKEVKVTGWYRRAPVPYMEVNRIEVLDGSLPSRNCYSYHARLAFAVILAVIGVVLTAIVIMG